MKHWVINLVATVPLLFMQSLALAETPNNTIWIDVRTPQELVSGKHPDAYNIPHKQITQRISEVTTDKNAEIKLYCAAGVRAQWAKENLEKMGFTNVKNMGGYKDVINQ